MGKVFASIWLVKRRENEVRQICDNQRQEREERLQSSNLYISIVFVNAEPLMMEFDSNEK